MGRLCAVPHCYTGYRKCSEKVSLYRVPDDDFFLSKWQEAIAREDRPITPKDYVCEKHFKEDDILRKRIRKDILETYQRPKLKPDAIPSVFPALPEFILKMTKKRRKILDTTPTNPDNKTHHNDSDNTAANLEDSTVHIKLETDVCTEMPSEQMEINTDEISIKTEIEDVPPPVVEEIEEFDPSGAKLYHCDECNYKTKFSHNLRTHKVKHLSGDDAFMSCEICTNYKTKWEITYINHMKSKHGVVLKEFFKCPFCPFKTKNRGFLSKHCDKEHDNESGESLAYKFQCEYESCEYKTESKALLNIHSLTHDKPKSQGTNSTFSCKECYFTTTSKRALVTHVKSAHNIGGSSSTEINKNLSKPNSIEAKETSSIKPKLKTGKSNLNKIEKQIFKCSRCAYKAHSQILLDKHLLKHQITNNTNTFCCKQCSFSTFSKSALENHQRDTFHCAECPFASNDNSEYVKHMVVHTNTSVEAINSSTSQNFELNSRTEEELEDMADIQEFCMVTIKEEHEEYLPED